MSEGDLAQKIADQLRPAAESAAREAVTSQMSSHMKNLEDALGNKIGECIDGKCDVIAAKAVEKLRPEIEGLTSKVEGAMTVKGHTPHDIFDCPTCKPIALEHLLKDEKHRGGLLEMVCKDGVCRPVVAENLWKDEAYRTDVVEKLLKDETQRGSLLGRICEDEECRKGISKIFEEKGFEVSESVGDESWAQRRLRERRERAGKTG